ncbi:hypothetical protein [Acidithiobacillus thiooxidans]|uniref:hypothetical protein n=1 Tax=Acidithiobacillus thiooxidans TaxID=930 RepID=UPI0009DB1B1A|nr:hypothetical protein [Acidithiobacillus thiooxidans]
MLVVDPVLVALLEELDVDDTELLPPVVLDVDDPLLLLEALEFELVDALLLAVLVLPEPIF